MPEKLFIQLHPDKPEVTWLRRGTAKGPVVSRVGPLSDLSGEGTDCRVIVFVPGADVVLLSANVPPMSQQRMSTAVPFALEDQLAGDLDSLHFAFGRRSGKEPLPAVVVDHACITAWLSRLEEAGVRPDVLVPEILALPFMPNTWTIFVDGETALVRSGLLSGFAVDPPNLALVVRDALLRAGGNAPGQIRLLPGARGTGTEAEDSPFPESLDCKIVEGSREPDKLVVLSTHFDEQHAINLLQGAYSREAGIGEIWRAWRVPIILVMVWLVVWIGGLLMDIADLSERNRLLTAEIETVYRQVFPDARKMNNLRIRMERSLDEHRKTGKQGAIGFLDLLGRIGIYLQSAKNARLTHLYFRSGELELRLEMTDLQAFDRLEAQLTRKAGLTVEVLSATTRENAVTGHLKIAHPR
ncbi:MAG: general secretion pathway protein L [Candidatus Kentron sp. G]|nr:MAG: general secretion pathway protein L [Candidatus Kentron sp. G]VFN05987.1 MAG: general secretion pathway protein L [Candidatus Kentron sp. G]VFN06174.1 MAG: general secretion pathway protein L [Candidatus Kentron sp. G]